MTPQPLAARVGAVLLTLLTGLLLAGLLGGCASPIVRNTATPSIVRVAADDTPLGGLARAEGVPPGRSGFRPLLLSTLALQTRLSLIERARVGIDLQTYHLADDATGHEMLRALRDAALRGVRVRLLVDDLHTAGTTDLLLGLAAYPQVEVRLYNPFPAGRDSLLLRLGSLLTDFKRLNRRMHNKLMVVDGRAAVVGGRNLADAYFMRSEVGNFFDFDLLCVGRVTVDLADSFDSYWNSRFAVPLQALARDPLDGAQRRASFERLAARHAPALPPGVPAAAQAAVDALATMPLVVADAQVYFDSPEKTGGGLGTPGGGPPLPVARLVNSAHERLIAISPYFLPSEQGMRLLASAAARGVSVQVLTNSLVDSDEPLVSLAYGDRRRSLLRAGIHLFELSSQRIKQEDSLRRALGDSVGRLHAKLGIIDDRLLLVGSMNVDPRSAALNTELTMIVDSTDLVRLVLGQFQPTSAGAVFEVTLGADGESLQWVGHGMRAKATGTSELHLDDEPGPGWLQRLQLRLLSLLVPNDLL
jgi:putative cardiolipin synthase